MSEHCWPDSLTTATWPAYGYSHVLANGKPKTSYESREVAEREADRLFGPHYNAYRCPRCGSWHIGRRNMREVAA